MTAPTAPRPFAGFEWMLAGRYLRTRRREGLVSVIVGINGHIFIAALDKPLTDYAEVAERVGKVAGIRRAIPLVEGQAFASSPYNGSGVLVRGVRPEDIQKIEAVSGNVQQGSLKDFGQGAGN